MILSSFEINKVLFNILDIPTPIIAMTMDPRVYYLQTHRCQNSDNSNFGYNEIIEVDTYTKDKVVNISKLYILFAIWGTGHGQ